MRALLVGLLLALALPASAQPLSQTLLDGLEFRTIGPAVMSGRVVDLAVDEDDPYTFYIATATGGLWKTTNNGVTLAPQFTDQPVHSIGAIALHPRADSILWVGTGERANRQSSSWGNGVYRSTDGGQTFTHLGLDESHHIGRIALHPDNPDIAFVAAMGHLWGPNDERGLYVTHNGGETWERLLFIDEHTGVVDVALDPSDPQTVYAATYQRRRRPFGFNGGGPGSALWKSEDGGRTWRTLSDGLPEGDLGRIGLSIYRTDPNIVYASIEQGWRYNASTAYGERRAGLYRSEDKGESWTWMSDWNPRPMYASQPLVDPSDDQRVYMMNAYSYSDDGGKTFRAARQSLHGDDRILWVNPNDSRHVIKGDDGGVGISYDRGQTWLYLTHLPVSQFYRVDVDMAEPYNVYGGLQDNGSWMGPSATYRAEGILNEDWIKTGGGDGFVNTPHPTEPNVLYNESQYLGLQRVDLATGEARSLRPGDPHGAIGPRRNWDAWGPDTPAPELGNAMAPANWEGPFVFSHHDPNTLYAGTNLLWRSRDGGATWTELGDLTTRVNRRHLPIMGEVAHDSTLSLDDGIPYYPTLTAIAESPFDANVLLVGTDDGNVQVSLDGGRTWAERSEDLPGLPAHTWINDVVWSRFAAGTAYLVANNYRNDDYANYVYRTDDFGRSWQRLDGTLPADRVARALVEDVETPDLLFLGTELGLFVSVDRGETWTAFDSNLPTVAVNDLVIHPRDHDLVVGTHGRGIWILDDIAPLRELTMPYISQSAHLFTVPTAQQIRYDRQRGHTGDMIFTGANPQAGAPLTYLLPDAVAAEDLHLAIYDATGQHVADVDADTTAGLHRVYWDMRHASLDALPSRRPTRFTPRGLAGPLVVPGLYVARLTVGRVAMEQSFRVEEDPRIMLPVEARHAWTQTQFAIADVYNQLVADLAVMQPVYWQVEEHIEAGTLEDDALAEFEEPRRMYDELLRRVRSLYWEAGSFTGPLTNDQRQQLAYYAATADRLRVHKAELLDRLVPRLNRRLSSDDRIAVEE